MAAGGQIAEFFGTLGFKIDAKDIKRFDKTLNLLEKRARRFTEGSLGNMRVRITKFEFSGDFNRRLHTALKARMQAATKGKGFIPEIKVDKFDIDRNVLLRDMREAVRYVEQNINMRIRPTVARPQAYGQGVGGVSGGRVGDRFGQGLGVGAGVGALGRGFIPGLGLAFGISQINKINQEMMGIDFASTAIFGGQEQGQEGMDWLKRFSQEAGLHYRAQAPAYQRMIASATAVGMSKEETQGIFAGVSRYGRTMGLDSESMKGSMRAIEQMLNKSQVYAEELKMQLAEKMPGVISAMAEAATGFGDEEGIQKLFKMMEEGQVSSSEVLGKFAAILDERARQGGAYERAIKSSAAEQQRFNSLFDQLIITFGKSGFEEGQAQIFRTLTAFLKEMNPLVEGLGDAWKYVDAVIRVPLGLLADAGVGLDKLADYTGVAKGELMAMGTVLAGLVFPFTRVFTLISFAMAAFEDFTGFLTGRKSLIGTLLGDDENQVRTGFIQLFSTLGETLKLVKERIQDIITLLTGDLDITWVEFLKEGLKQIEEALHRINVLLGGKTRAELAAESETNPVIREAMQGNLPNTYTERLKEDSVFSGVGNFLKNYTPQGILWQKNPVANLLFGQDGDFYSKANSVLEGMGLGSTPEAIGYDSVGIQGNPQGSSNSRSVSNNIGDINIYTNSDNPEEIGRSVQQSLSDMLQRYGEAPN